MEFLAGYLLGARAAGQAAGMAAAARSSQLPQIGRQLDLDERVDRLAVVVEAMWSLLEQAGYSPEDLEARIAELSKRLVETPVMSTTACPKCQAMVPRGLDHCQFCGEPTGDSSPFDGLAT